MQKNTTHLLIQLFCCSVLVFSSSCSPTQKVTKNIGILSALPQELAEIENKMTVKENIILGEDKFIIGRIGNVPVVATLSGMGKVNASVAAQRLVSNFNASAIIFTGVAGGINPALEIGDIVFGVQTFQHDFGFLGSTFTVHTPGILPEIGLGEENASVQKNLAVNWPNINGEASFLTSVLEFVTKEPIPFTEVVVNGKNYLPVVKRGVVATGDQFIAQDNKKDELRNLGADLVEMEGGAVAQVARKNNIPCLIIRSISDKAGEHAQIDFGSFFAKVAKNNALVVDTILKHPTYANYMGAFLK